MKNELHVTVERTATSAPVDKTARTEKLGVVYTRPWVVELMLDLAGYKPEANLVDAVAVEPAAGDGSFLLQMADRLLESCRLQGRSLSDCADSIFAYELDPQSAERSRRAVARLLLERGIPHPKALELARGWIRTGDYLLSTC